MTPIRAVLEYYGADLPNGSRNAWIACQCPFHTDSVASASVHYIKGAFNCHTCGVAGDAVSIVMRREGLTRAGAREFVAGLPGGGDESVSTGGQSGSGTPLFGGRAGAQSGDRPRFSVGGSS